MASIAKQPGGKWRARYRDSAGKEHAKHFARKTDAQHWLDEVTASVVTGMYVDPKAGKVTFKQYAEQWAGIQMHRPTTQDHVANVLKNHAYPAFGDRPINLIMPSDIGVWVKRMSLTLSPSFVGTIHGIVSGIFRSAIRDRRIVSNPCDGTKLPTPTKKEIVPPTTETIGKLVQGAPERWATLFTFAAGTGMRNGECLGLTRDRVDFLRRTVQVDRQMVTVVGRAPFLAPPKTRASVRTIPLPNVVVTALSEHVRVYDIAEDGLLFCDPSNKPISRTAFSARVWIPTVAAAKITDPIRFHDLRHYYASLLIRHGESIKTVQARLGHASAAETLDTYSHLWPDSDDRTREAIDSILGAPADSVRTERSS
ncbi:MAG: tyrosine-type recombinase/integrase [Actinomycetes bacterium]